jgi:hypothetical protein
MLETINKKQGFIIPLIIAVVAILAIGAGVFVYESKKVEAPVVVDTSDWKTCTNIKYGYELKYPSTWNTYSRTEGGYKENVCDYAGGIRIFEFDPHKDIESGYIHIEPTWDVKNNTVEEYGSFEEYLSSPVNRPVGSFEISDFYGEKAVISSGNFESINIYHNKAIYRLNFSIKDKELLKHILSTFKFITPAVEKPIACTMDAEMCPDGSYVGRSGPKCEFVCPSPMVKGSEAKIGQTIVIGGIKITPLELIEDSRCPEDVTCVWAGKVRIKVRLSDNTKSEDVILSTGESYSNFTKGSISFSVLPEKTTTKTIPTSEYRFNFVIFVVAS